MTFPVTLRGNGFEMIHDYGRVPVADWLPVANPA